MSIISDEQVNMKCAFCGLPIPVKRIDGLRSEVLGIQVEDLSGLVCSESCRDFSRTYTKPHIERKVVRS